MKYTIILISLLTSSCGVYYKNEIFKQENNDKWRLRNNYSVFECGDKSVSTEGVYTKLIRRDALLGIPLYGKTSKIIPGISFTFKNDIIKTKRCEIILISIRSNDKIYYPVNVTEFSRQSDGNSFLYCTYSFDEELKEPNELDIIFNSSITECDIPSLRLIKGENSGYRNVPFQ